MKEKLELMAEIYEKSGSDDGEWLSLAGTWVQQNRWLQDYDLEIYTGDGWVKHE